MAQVFNELKSTQMGGNGQNEIWNVAFGMWGGVDSLLPTEFVHSLPNSTCENTTGLTGVDCTLASITGGQAGKCLELTRTAETSQSVYQTFTITSGGRIQRISAYVKSGTSGNEAWKIQIRTTADVLVGETSGTTSASWVYQYFDVELNSGDYRLVLVKNSATAGTMLFDTIVAGSVEPGKENAGEAVDGPNGWTHYGAAAYMRRETYGTNIRNGCMYSLYMVPSVAEEGVLCELRFPSDVSALLPWWYRFRGRPVSFGCWIVSSSSKAGISMTSANKTITKYHSGGNSWEWVEINDIPVVDELNYFYVSLITEGGAGNKYAHFAQPMLSFTSFIGSGNTTYTKNETIYLKTSQTIYTVATFTANTGLILSSITPTLPRNMKSVLLHMTAQCATAGKYLDISGLRLYFPVANQPISIQGWVPTTNGNRLELTRDDTITGATINVVAVGLF